MKTSQQTSVNNLIHKWNSLGSVLDSITAVGAEKSIEISGCSGSFFSFFLRELSAKAHGKSLQYSQYKDSSAFARENFRDFSSDFIIVVPTEYEAENIKNDLNVVFPECEVFVFPWWATVPYRPASRGSIVFGQRAGVLSKLIRRNEKITFEQHTRVFIFTERAFISKLPPPEYLFEKSFSISKGQSFDPVKISKNLTELGYLRVPRVSCRGEYSLRGEVLDVFLPCEDNPVRILFDFDQIENLKYFDQENQMTLSSIDHLLIYPMKEVVWTDELVKKASDELEKYQESSVNQEISDKDILSGGAGGVHLPFTEKALENKKRMLNELSSGHECEGEEFFYDYLWDREYTLLDYIDERSMILFYDYDKMLNAVLTIGREYSAMYHKSRLEFPVLPPHMLLLDFEKQVEKFSNSLLFRTVSRESEEKKSSFQLDVDASRSFFGNLNYFKEEVEKLIEDNWNIFVYADNENQSLRINEILKKYTCGDENYKPKNPLKLLSSPLTAGFAVSEIRLLIVQENEIFGRRKYTPKATSRAKSQAIDTFVELQPGDYVVHVQWGIGKFHGIERVKSLGNERDYVKLEYADEEYAFVPIEQVNLVQRYIGNEGEHPRLDRIGSKSWENRKNKVAKAVEDIAQKLIDLYSRRKASVGFAFPKETEWQAAFEASFPYEDTPDQITVTEEIKRDMESATPMDRLVCGDVGYGKTEMAMRAAFKAVMGGKQVAFLAPTTILAEQHYDNCIERFKNFPVRIARLSRFVTPAEAKKILLKVQLGEIDVLVGTHRIIQKDVIFKNLGLMIIDEEQRFGVKDKEKLKVLKNNIDCLTMSATPIPRTLHMSLLKIRDMSLLTTPPQNRQPIETVIDAYSEDRIARAIRQEIDRGGQIFYLHNRVESLYEVRRRIEQICPEVLVDTAHGQMSSDELDDIFHRFKNGAFHVLVATTIIENGIDIPNVNTIIIDRADMYGVSQLYQLRGRVGRSDRKAYAYLLYPENKALSEVAMKRLQVISDFTELGSGFKIAMKDMEIRGAGNLLGKDQSGDVYAVGFDMYVRLLNEAVQRLTMAKDFEAQSDVLMEMEYTGFIPDSYITNPQIKMEIYKKIAAVMTDSEFENLLGELDDRFGPIPDEVSSLLALAEIRIICKKLKINSIKERMGEVKIEFGRVSNISVDKLMTLIHDNPGTIYLKPDQPTFIFIKLGKIGLKEKSEFIREKLNRLL